MLVLPELPFTQRAARAVVVAVSPRRFLELALLDGLDARVPWQTAFALSQLLQVPFPTRDSPPERIPDEFLIARWNERRLELYHVLYEEL